MSSQTPNYNFIVCTGSDLVNPLTQIMPNFTSLDTILRNIANTGITTATEVKTGTVHALTRVDPNVPMIRFQAVSRFDSGDTFTVDGVSVTATLPDGETLPDGGYIIGSMVLCELRDTQLTVYTSDSIANVNAAFNIGNTDISGIGDGSIKGAISTINGDLSDVNNDVSDINAMLSTFKVVASGYSGRELVNILASYPEHSMFIMFAKRHADNSHGCCYLITKYENDSTPYIYTISNNGFELITNNSGTLWLVYGSTSDENRYSYDFSFIQIR